MAVNSQSTIPTKTQPTRVERVNLITSLNTQKRDKMSARISGRSRTVSVMIKRCKRRPVRGIQRAFPCWKSCRDWLCSGTKNKIDLRVTKRAGMCITFLPGAKRTILKANHIEYISDRRYRTGPDINSIWDYQRYFIKAD